MTLTEDQQTAVKRWIEAGDSLSDVQKKLREDFSLSLTYMETRFLVDDLKLSLKEEILEQPKVAPSADVPNTSTSGLPPDEVLPPEGTGGSVRVTIDQITRPGSLVSGKATFSDGQSAEWNLDQLGRLGLNPDTPGYRPSESDIMDFQMELQRLARTQGF